MTNRDDIVVVATGIGDREPVACLGEGRSVREPWKDTTHRVGAGVVDERVRGADRQGSGSAAGSGVRETTEGDVAVKHPVHHKSLPEELEPVRRPTRETPERVCVKLSGENVSIPAVR